MSTLIAQPTVLTGLPLYDTVICDPTSGLDDRMVAAMISFGWLEQTISPDGTMGVTPTNGFANLLGLNEIGVFVEDGEWVVEVPECCPEVVVNVNL